MDGLTRLLLTKYSPGKLQGALQAPTATTKAKAPPVRRPIAKSAPEALQEIAGMVVIMSSNDYSESVIFAAVTKFNREYPEYMSRSFTLPVTLNGIEAGSWIITSIEDL